MIVGAIGRALERDQTLVAKLLYCCADVARQI